MVNATHSEDKVIQLRHHAAIEANNTTDQGKQRAPALEYKAGTERLSLLIGLTLGILLASSDISMANQDISLEKALPVSLQLRRAVDILHTAGLLAGSSQSFHDVFSNKIPRAVTGGDLLPDGGRPLSGAGGVPRKRLRNWSAVGCLL